MTPKNPPPLIAVTLTEDEWLFVLNILSDVPIALRKTLPIVKRIDAAIHAASVARAAKAEASLPPDTPPPANPDPCQPLQRTAQP